ncbi:MAG: hypothetical protein V2G41_09875 [bacterium JZ-2024 1]
MPEIWITLTRAADMLGISTYTLKKRWKEYGFKAKTVPGTSRLQFLLKEVVDAGGKLETAYYKRERRRERKRKLVKERVKAEIESLSRAGRLL